MRHFQPAVLLSITTACALAACSSAPQKREMTESGASTAKAAVANLASASGSLVSGRVQFTPMSDGVHLIGEIGGLGRGATHAIHIHEHGDCSMADASSAGAHFNPSNKPHGRAGGKAHHAGDMDNLVANGDGVARVDIHLRGVTLGGGAANDIANRAVIVHASPDDYATQPTGNAGGRVACGVIRVTQ